MVFSDSEISSGFVISTFSVLYTVLFAWRVPRTPIELQYSWHKALLVPRLFEAFLIARQEQTAKEQCEARAVRWGNSLLHQKISRHLDRYYHLRCISYLHCKIVAIYIINRQDRSSGYVFKSHCLRFAESKIQIAAGKHDWLLQITKGKGVCKVKTVWIFCNFPTNR